MDLYGKNVIVIGGSSGMGLATARLVRQHGAKVTIASRSRAKLDQTVRQIGDARAIVADITNESDVREVFEELDQVDHVFISERFPEHGRLFCCSGR